MSFMFKPLSYDDPNAINHPQLSKDIINDITFGTYNCGKRLADEIKKTCLNKGTVVAFDGYSSASFVDIVNAFAQNLHQNGIATKQYAMADVYKSTDEINNMVASSLPNDYEDDPVLLFGELYTGNFGDFFDSEKLASLLKEIDEIKTGTVLIISGYGCSAKQLQDKVDKFVYIDVTPKTAAIRARNGQLLNIGDSTPRPFKEIMRRNYYVDFNVIIGNRRQLFDNDKVDYYINGDYPADFVMMTGKTIKAIMDSLAKYPFRTKPVYLDGIWGGEFMRKARNLPIASRNVAWIFDLIPMEVSVVVDVNGKNVEFPFCTFVQYSGKEIMGTAAYNEFNGYFPIRFNYDDTYHSNGNMSIQVHPDAKMCMSRYKEFGSQDEAYYVVATAHDARTYVGFNNNADIDEFIDKVKESEKTGATVDYEKYINHINSVPGRQIMLPGGTIHSSGRGQLILELGSLTMGSYTYKMYDYNRVDNDGNRRPIHSKMAEIALKRKRNADWVSKNIAIEPIPDGQGNGWKQYIVGKTDLMYYYTRRLDLDTGASAEFTNDGSFTVLSLLDGEECLVYSKSNPDFCYHQKFLDVIIVPAEITDYVIKNEGYQPCTVHKTALRPDFVEIRKKQTEM